MKSENSKSKFIYKSMISGNGRSKIYIGIMEDELLPMFRFLSTVHDKKVSKMKDNFFSIIKN